ncbi:5430_t:CDS:1 [Paraglomus brasilianum]|uniref:5430_t:CDS:1 n=1 Tax=Paraglomus brasilianum TaxID=144538 RepID=A0A9N8ZMA0_9GLOM|nr:5430_t:CDS:1 [Paraglomus brasilianum]
MSRRRLRKLEKQQSDVETIRGDSEDSLTDRKIKRIRSDSDSSFEESSELSSVDSNSSKEDSSDGEPIIQNIGNKRGRPRKTHRKTNSLQITQKTKPRLGRRKLDPNDAKATDNAGQTNLHIACMRNNIHKVRTLIEKGANINATDNSEWTPLHEAAYGGYYEIVVILLEHGAKVNVVDKEGDTPLHDACYQGHVDIIKILLEYGADVEKTNDKNERPEDVINRSSVESDEQKEQVIKLLNTPIQTEKKTKKDRTQINRTNCGNRKIQISNITVKVRDRRQTRQT